MPHRSTANERMQPTGNRPVRLGPEIDVFRRAVSGGWSLSLAACGPMETEQGPGKLIVT